jgi:hypothetical protein
VDLEMTLGNGRSERLTVNLNGVDNSTHRAMVAKVLAAGAALLAIAGVLHVVFNAFHSAH